jgi:adenylate cyclase
VVTTGIDRARLLCRLGEAYWLMGLPGRAWEPLAEGVKLLEQLGEPLEAARHRLTLGRCYWERSLPSQAKAEYEHARQVLEPAGPSRELALAYIRLAGLNVFNFEFAAAQELAEKAIQTAAEADAADMRIWAYNFLGVAIARQGDYPTGIQFLERSAQEALDQGLHNIAGNALHNLMTCYLSNMEMDKLRDLVKRLEAIKIERWANLSSQFAKMIWEHQTGHVEDALRTAREFLARARATDSTSDELIAHHGICSNCVELERFDEAREHLAPSNAESDAQDVVGGARVWIRFHVATGDLAGAVKGAELLLGVSHPETNDDAAFGAIEAFVKAGRIEDAKRMQAALEAGPAPVHRLTANLGRARIRLASEETANSISEVEDTIRAFQSAGLVLSELQARLVLAEVLQKEGDAGRAEAAYRVVLETSGRMGIRLLERQAREGLAGLGIVVDTAVTPPRPDSHAPQEIGERLVTVMFADVRGYTAMTGERPPAEMVDLVATYQRWAAQEVVRHLGTVDKFAGDAVMATFNISGTQVDHAAHALKAALALRDKAALLGLPVGIGIATGPAVVGALKSGANLSVVGEATNLASRLQSQAAAGEVMLSDETYRRLVDTLDATPEQLELKGFAKPVMAYRVAAPATATP